MGVSSQAGKDLATPIRHYDTAADPMAGFLVFVNSGTT
jgi:hypothetical protein